MIEREISRRHFFGLGLAAAVVAKHGWADSITGPVPVTTSSGVLYGQALNANVNVFRGVPFAEPPVGPLRFMPPMAVKPWKGPRDASEFAPAAMQPGTMKTAEDCLYLNVWAPREKGSYPVFVWIHGGGLTGGRASDPLFDGARFAKEGVVVVTIAYRLGVFGFVDVSPVLGAEYAESTNNGFLDVLTALEWVQKNIAAFGGDPKRVTVGGESAGAKLTDLLLASKRAQGLFSQAISESGGIDRCLDRETSKKVGASFAGFFKAKAGGESLRDVSPQKLLELQQSFLKEGQEHKYPLRPVADGDLLPAQPLESIAKFAQGKRLLIGTNRDESVAFLGAKPEKVAGADLSNVSLEKFMQVEKRYGEIYPKKSEPEHLVQAVTAEEYWVPTMRVANAAVRGGAEVLVYRLDYSMTQGALQGLSPHGFDQHLAWGHPDTRNVDALADKSMTDRMHGAWLAFIKGQTPVVDGVRWPKWDAAGQRVMLLDSKSRVQAKPQKKELDLWDGMLEGVVRW